MYEANGKPFTSYMAAVRAAQANGCEVFEVRADGKFRRWAPAAKVSAKKLRAYSEHKAAYEAQQK